MFTSKHHPTGGAQAHCDNSALEAAIACFQNGDAGSLDEIVRLVEPRARTLIRFFKTHHYRPEDELLSDINFKLMRSVLRFDAQRATGFAYVSRIIESTLKTSVTNQRRNWARYSELSVELANTLPAKADNLEGTDDLVFKIKSWVKTSLIDPIEVAAQRWFVESFCQEGFSARRHTCADACMGVFQLSHARSRELHDLSALEVRRALYDEIRKPTQIIASRLFGSRCAWMVDYRAMMSAEEFTKFFYLMKNLAPYLLLLIVDPAKNGSHRRERCPTIGRPNLELVLAGDPAAVPLF